MTGKPIPLDEWQAFQESFNIAKNLPDHPMVYNLNLVFPARIFLAFKQQTIKNY
jgi:hypothetical protein